MTLLTALPPPVVDLKVTRELFIVMARVGNAMFQQDPVTGKWQATVKAAAICSAIDPSDPNLKDQALAAYLEYVAWAETQATAAWVP
jgi:hypothetical protein